MATRADRRQLVRSGSLTSSGSSEYSDGENDSGEGATRIKSAIVQTSIGRTLDSSPHSQRKKFSNSPDRLEQYHSPSASPKDYRGYHMTPDRSPDEPPRRRHMTPESNGDQRRHHLSRRSPRLSPTGRRRRRRSFSSSPPPRSRSLLASREAELDEAPPPKKKKEELDPILTRTGGAYIPPARLRMMQQSITDKSSVAYQRLSWEALKKSINGLINKVNVSNIGSIVQELFQENVVRGRGVLARSLVQAQAASPTFTHVYAALVSIINTKFPQTGELIAKRLLIQFRRGFRRNNKSICVSAVKFLAHLVNQQVLHELVALEMLTLLLEEPTDDTVEVSIGFLKDCGQKLTEVSPRGVLAVFETLRSILHSGKLTPRVQYMIEVMFAVRKDNFKEHPAVIPELDLVQEEDQITHLLSLGDDFDGEEILNVFHADPDFAANEEKYKTIKAEILGEGSSSGSSGEESDEEDSEEEGEEEQQQLDMLDMTDAKVTTLRRTIYLTIMSSLDYEECAHKILKNMEAGHEREIANMVIECCSQERSYLRFYGLLGQRFCQLNQAWVEQFDDAFQQQYATVHRLETNKLRNVAKFFGQLFYADALPWTAMACIHLNEDETNSSSRIFVKILFQELSEFMGLSKLNERLKDPLLAMAFEGLLPRDNPKNTRFAINFFTSIGLGGLTDDLREHLKNAQRMIMAQKQEVSSSDTDSDSDSNSSESSSGSSDTESSGSEDEKSRRQKRQRERGKGKDERRKNDSRKKHKRSGEDGHRSMKDKRGGSRERMQRDGSPSPPRERERERRRQKDRTPSRERTQRDGSPSPPRERERERRRQKDRNSSRERAQRGGSPSPPRERERERRREKDRNPSRERTQRDGSPSPPRERERERRRQKDRNSSRERAQRGGSPSPPRERERERRREKDRNPSRERTQRDESPSPPRGRERERRRQKDRNPSRERTQRGGSPSPPREREREQKDRSPSREMMRRDGSSPSPSRERERERGRNPSRERTQRAGSPSPPRERERERRRQKDRNPSRERAQRGGSPSPPRERERERRRQKDRNPSRERTQRGGSPSPPREREREQKDRSPSREMMRRYGSSPSPSRERERERGRNPSRERTQRAGSPSPPRERERERRRQKDRNPSRERAQRGGSPSPPRERERERRRQKDRNPSRERMQRDGNPSPPRERECDRRRSPTRERDWRQRDRSPLSPSMEKERKRRRD